MKTDSLTYTQITKDWDRLVNHLELDSINIIGWSDGGIIGLLMGINHPSKVKKIAKDIQDIMAGVVPMSKTEQIPLLVDVSYGPNWGELKKL